MPCKAAAGLLPALLVLLLAAHGQAAGTPLPEGHSFNKSASRKWMINNAEVCLGTDNGMSSTQVPNMTRYQVLMYSFVNCKRIFGNLEITHIRPEDLYGDFDSEMQPNGEMVRRQRTPFWFLSQLEEITGYLLVFNVTVPRITFPNLKIIWGGKKHDGQGLEINYSKDLHVISFPALRSIHEGRLKVEASPNLCFFQTLVDYSELLGPDSASRVLINSRQFDQSCPARTRCHAKCGQNPCFGPEAGDCQVVYRRNCGSCSSGTCYRDETGAAHCCDDACTGGCYGDGEDKCIACKHYEEDGRCVRSCRGNSEYNATSMVRETLTDDRKRYYYEKHCVQECPQDTLIEEDRFCVTRCSDNHYRDHLRDERRCVPCNGTCPKVCVMDQKIDFHTIQRLVNCSEIDGYIEILNHVFEPHTPDDGDPTVMIPALTPQHLDVLKSVKVITGYVIVDGGKKSNAYARPRSLDFLENLEIIEGRKLYHKKFAMYVVGSNDLHSLGLRSLRKVRNGVIGFRSNPNLCYGSGIPFKQRYGVNASWTSNMAEDDCEKLGRTCDPTCHPSMGCWGPGPAQCVLCRYFKKDGICASHCPVHDGYYIPIDQSNNAQVERRCEPCSEECSECYGPNADQCNKCRFFEYRPSGPHGGMKCVRTCPKDTFASGNQCIQCHEACLLNENDDSGCTGSGTNLGRGGCNTCLYAVERKKEQLECLAGQTEEVCAENNLTNYHLALSPKEIRQQIKFTCHKCPPECKKCSQLSTDKRSCECAEFLMRPNSQRNNLTLLEGSFEVTSKSANETGVCEKCHPLCDPEFVCFGPLPTQCQQCRAGVLRDDEQIECLEECPEDQPFIHQGMCSAEDTAALKRRQRNVTIVIVVLIFLTIAVLIAYLTYRCMNYRKKYEKEAQMHLPEIPPVDPRKLTHRPNMRRLNLISVDELDDSTKYRNRILGQGAFGIVYAGKWKPPGRNTSIPVAIKAINPSETKHVTEAEMLKEAGLMASVEHEHLLPLVGVCVAKGGLKIVTILRPLGSLLKFLGEHKNNLGAKQSVLYCYQISSAMEFLARKKIIHRDLAARNVLVRNINHVEVTDFGLAQMLQGSESMIVLEDHNFARELANQLEKGHRLKQPANCSQELYQELLNCWLIDPESRPTFAQLKSRFEAFCRAPQIFVQDRRAAQHLDSISDTEQMAMIEKLLQDNDFTNPLQLEPEDYRQPGRLNLIRSSNLTDTTFLPDTPTTAHFADNPLGTNRSNNSSRYRTDPTQGQQLLSEMDTDEENYLMPKPTVAREDEQGLVYTPVVGVEKGHSPKGSPAHEYSNDSSRRLLYADSDQASDEQPAPQYVNQQTETAF
ncbi:Receptor protein-tyrosine kinase [Aphelenchoides fujianensis]|nr:Receptor protein-tyrosine kinase [Aphelenchoides fujianensis]